jgi:hypothetical protein
MRLKLAISVGTPKSSVLNDINLSDKMAGQAPPYKKVCTAHPTNGIIDAEGAQIKEKRRGKNPRASGNMNLVCRAHPTKG